MPKLKRPDSLEKLTFDILVANVVSCCIDLCESDLLTELHRYITHIKHHFYNHLPVSLFLKFCQKFLEKFCEIASERWFLCEYEYCGAALEMIMDLNVVGLTGEGHILQYVNSSNANRIRGLTVLDWSKIWRSFPKRLDNFQLKDLTTFNLPMDCTDSNLEIIGSHCSKLKVLWISGSERVTDEGLRALRQSSKLRDLFIARCSVTDAGVRELLNTHGKLEQLSVSDICVVPENPDDVLSWPTSPTIYPSMKRFVLNCYTSRNSNVLSALAVFPNLTCLELSYSLPNDFVVLKDLKNLTKLKLTGHSSMRSLESTLTDIGENIHVLSLNLQPIRESQNDLDFVFKVCPNLEQLTLHYLVPELSSKLFIPSFKELRTLQMFPDPIESGSHLEFGVMPVLEKFSILTFAQISNVIQSMLDDAEKFPNLKLVTINIDEERQADRINEFAKRGNIDFFLEVKHSSR